MTMKESTKTRAVADHRLEQWLTEWGRVVAVRLDGGTFPDTRGEASNSRAPGGRIPNLAAGYIDIGKYVETAPPTVAWYLHAKYVTEKVKSVDEAPEAWFGEPLSPREIKIFRTRLVRGLRKWRDSTARRLQL
jgi:hypothetical protein